MKEYGDLNTVGKAWIVLADTILSKGFERKHGSETFTELKGISFSISGDIMYDNIVSKYGNKTKIEWMRNNFEVLAPVKELQDANSYASRLFNYCGTKNQIAWIVEKINADRFTRSASITTFEPLTDVNYIPCISMLDFDIEENTLNLYVYSRGLDFGNKAYGNMICIADILKLVAKQTKLCVGNIYFICKSIHIYDTEYEEMKKIICEVKKNYKWVQGNAVNPDVR